VRVAPAAAGSRHEPCDLAASQTVAGALAEDDLAPVLVDDPHLVPRSLLGARRPWHELVPAEGRRQEHLVGDGAVLPDAAAAAAAAARAGVGLGIEGEPVDADP